MRKTRIVLLATLVLCAFLHTPGKAENWLPPAGMFQGTVGRIHFSLPGVPQRVEDRDYPGFWKNSVQLFGDSLDGAEYQLRTADIQAWLEGYQKEWPDADPLEWKAQALFGYSQFMIRTFQGQYADLTAREKDGLVVVQYSYTYPDSPGVEYQGKAILDGNLAVSLTGAVSPGMNQAFDQLRGLSPKEAEKAAVPMPETWEQGAFSALFPSAIHRGKTADSLVAACFSPDFSLLQIQAFPLGVRLPDKEGAALRDELTALAKRVMLPTIQGETVYAPEVSFPAFDMVMLAFESVNTYPFGEEFGQRFLCRLYLGRRGVYYVWAADTETGQAFMDSLQIEPLQ